MVEALRASTAHGDAWRCLRCGDYVLGLEPGTGPLAGAPAPMRGRALRDALILRLVAVERSLRGLLMFAAAYGVWTFDGSRDAIDRMFRTYMPRLESAAEGLGVDLGDTLPVRLAESALRIPHATLMLVVAGVAAYGALELVEGVGLWSGRRWGEYVAVIGTSAFMPYEVYDIVQEVTALRVATFLVNLAVVLWLVWTKHLFGMRGGHRELERRRADTAILVPAPHDTEPLLGLDAAAGRPGRTRSAPR